MKLKKLVSVVLATAMIASMGSFAAMAETDPDTLKVRNATNQVSVTLPLKKVLKKEANVTTPDGATFTFTFSKDASSDFDVPALGTNGVFTTTFNKNTTNDAATALTNTVAENIFAGVLLDSATEGFKAAGKYAYDLTESQSVTGYTPTDNEKFYFDSTKYLLEVYVANKTDSERYIKAVTLKKVDSDGNTTKVDISKDGSAIDFTNYYLKDANTPENPDNPDGNVDTGVVIKKIVAGDFGNRTTDFNFTVTFEDSALVAAMKSAGITDILAPSVTTAGKTFTKSNDGRTFNFTLHHDESIAFKVLAGTTYTVKETLANGTDYAPEIKTYSNVAKQVSADDFSSLPASATAGSATALASELTATSATAGEKANAAIVTNTYKSVTPTGIVINNLPYVLMGLLAACGAAMYLFLKRRHEENI